MACSIARTLDVIGEPWSPLVLRNVYIGITRFDQLQQSLGISRKVLAERLKWLTGKGVLDRRQYAARPPRYEYVLTARGLELFEVLMVMVACGRVSHVELSCSACGQPMRATDIDVLPGPGAGEPAPQSQPASA
jgi:DNA-binding HxlR family transcriptional regulator